MQVQWRNPTRSARRCARVLPLRNHKVIRGRAKHSASQRRQDNGRMHGSIKSHGTRDSSPGDIVVPMNLAKILRDPHGNAEIAAEVLAHERVEGFQPQHLALEYPSEIP